MIRFLWFLIMFSLNGMESLTDGGHKKQPQQDYEIELVVDKQEARQLSPFESLSNEVHYQIIKQRLLSEDKQDRWKALKPMAQINKQYRALCSYDVMPQEIKKMLPYPYQPLTIKNMRAEFQFAQQLNDQQRRDECAKFIKKHAMEVLTPGWGYFGKKFFALSVDEREALAKQRINEIIPEEMNRDFSYKYELRQEIERRESLCMLPHIFCPVALVSGAVIGLVILLNKVT